MHTKALSEKMRRMQMRNKKDQDIQQPLSALRPSPQNARCPPKHMDLLDAASLHDETSLRKLSSPLPQSEHMDVTPPRAPRSKPYLGDNSRRNDAYKNYMASAFGAESLRPTREPSPHKPMGDRRPSARASALTTDSMEVNFHISPDIYTDPLPTSSRHLRPKIQVQIPGKPTLRRQPSAGHLIGQMDRKKSKRKLMQTEVVVSSHDTDIPTMAVVSPLSVVEMPKPRRPFSAASLEDTAYKPPMTRSHSDDSSTRHEYNASASPPLTRRSSMTSLTSNKTMQKPVSRRHSIAFSIADPVAAGVFDPAPPLPKMPSHLRMMKSATSLAAPDTNKPLPPEPGMQEVRPLRIASQSYSRGSDMHPRRKAPSPLNISRSSTIATLRPSRMSTLRSRYTPADLDALDAAFVKSSPQMGQFGHIREPSWEQAQHALEEHLTTISEDDAASGLNVPLACDPLQISRMTNAMVPTRNAPAPPSISSTNSIKNSDGSTSSRKRNNSRMSHVVLQMKNERSSSGSEIRSRISASLGLQRNNSKAYKILGRSEPADAVAESIRMERDFSNESYGSSSSPDHSYNGDMSSPSMSNRGDTTTPETDVSSIPDAAFEEIRTRLELLSPKEGPHHEIASMRDHADGDRPITAVKDSPALAPHSGNDEDYSVMLEGALPPAYFPSPKNADSHAVAMTSFAERPRSLASIAASEIPEIYADLPNIHYADDDDERSISADAAEIVLLRILQHLDNLQDLFATATVSRGFYRTFKRHELALMKNSLYGMSPAAWELREVSNPYPGLQEEGQSPLLDYTPSLYLQHYMRDMYTMIALKSMILLHCESFLRADTITALAGGENERAGQIDDAFWRVWTFCQIFGCNSGREDDIAAQMDWLRGGVEAKKEKKNQKPSKRRSLVPAPACRFGHGNAGGLSAAELYDMTEIWTCMGVLVRGFQGKRAEAREYGIYDNAPADLVPGDIEAEDKLLEEWTYHLMTLAPPTVLDVTSPTSPTATTFARAKAQGYTTWVPPAVSRSTFLKEAVSRVYQERIELMHSNPATPDASRSPVASQEASSTTFPLTKGSEPSSHVRSISNTSTDSQASALASRWRCAKHAAEIRAKRSEPGFSNLPPSEDRPMSEFPSVLEKLALGSQADVPAVPALPSTTYSRSASAASSKDNLAPIEKSTTPAPMATATAAAASLHKPSASVSDTAKTVISALTVPRGPQVRDPVDFALEKLVNMGFSSTKAKRALADSETGNGVDFDVALEALVRERKRDVDGLMHQGYRGRRQSTIVRDRARMYESLVGTMPETPAPSTLLSSLAGQHSPPPEVPRMHPARRNAMSGNWGPGVGLGIGGVNV